MLLSATNEQVRVATVPPRMMVTAPPPPPAPKSFVSSPKTQVSEEEQGSVLFVQEAEQRAPARPPIRRSKNKGTHVFERGGLEPLPLGTSRNALLHTRHPPVRICAKPCSKRCVSSHAPVNIHTLQTLFDNCSAANGDVRFLFYDASNCTPTHGIPHN